MAELYLLTTKDTACIPEEYFREHFPRRMERSEKYRFEEDRLRCLGVGVLLKEILDVKEEDLRTGPHGKLYMPGERRKFNVSHSGEYTVLAVSDGEVGVDIERLDERHLDVARRVFVPEELEWMKKNTERFYTLWTCKESVMKQLGLGMFLPPDSFSVIGFLQGKCIETGGKTLYAKSIPLPGYRIAVCTEQPEDVKIMEWNVPGNAHGMKKRST